MSKPKSIVKQKKEATHEFFPRSKPQTSSSGTTNFSFNKAPMNKAVAYQEARSKVIADNDNRA